MDDEHGWCNYGKERSLAAARLNEKIPFFGKHQKEKLSSNGLWKRGPHKEAAFLRLIRATQQISVRQGGVLLDRLAAHPHTRVQRHTHANSKGDMHTHTHTHIHTTLNTFTPRHNYTQFRPESKRHIKEKSTSLSRCALMLKLKVDQKSGR